MGVAVCTAVFLLALIGQAGAGLERTLLSADFYGGLSQELEAPALVHAYLWERLFARPEGELPARSFTYRAVATAASPEWLGQQLEQGAGEVIALLRGERSELVLAVDLRERKDIFKKELIGGLSAGQLEKLELTESYVEEFIEQAGFPDELVIADFNRAGEAGGAPEPAFLGLRRAGKLYLVGPFLALGVLLLLCCYWAGPGKGLQWYGTSLFAGGLCGLAGFYTAVPFLVNAVWQRVPFLEKLLGYWLSVNPQLPVMAVRAVRAPLLHISLAVAVAGLLLAPAGWVLLRFYPDRAGKRGAV